MATFTRIYTHAHLILLFNQNLNKASILSQELGDVQNISYTMKNVNF